LIGNWIFFSDTLLVQQVDFLETILEETSDDLQSDSDRSGTTYWLGSDSETESVIHIRARQRAGENAASKAKHESSITDGARVHCINAIL